MARSTGQPGNRFSWWERREFDRVHKQYGARSFCLWERQNLDQVREENRAGSAGSGRSDRRSTWVLGADRCQPDGVADHFAVGEQLGHLLLVAVGPLPAVVFAMVLLDGVIHRSGSFVPVVRSVR